MGLTHSCAPLDRPGARRLTRLRRGLWLIAREVWISAGRNDGPQVIEPKALPTFALRQPIGTGDPRSPVVGLYASDETGLPARIRGSGDQAGDHPQIGLLVVGPSPISPSMSTSTTRLRGVLGVIAKRN